MQPAVVYAHELSRLGHGRPMWSPDRPETPVEIGDVGFIENETGSFKRLFNVTRPPWDRLNSLGVPGNFKRLDLELIAKTENASYLKTGPICSHSINKILKTPSDSSQTFANKENVTYSFDCSRDQGALLYLSRDADRTHCCFNNIMPRYMAANYHHWCEFALSKNFEIGGPTYEGPILVRGWVKSSGWGVAAWDSGGPPCSVSVSCSSAESPTSGISFQVSEQSSGTHFRSGPHLRSERPTSRPFPESHSIPEAMGHSQCVFLSYYKAKSRKEFTPQVMKTLEDQKQERSNVEVDHAEGSHKLHDPLNDALDYILEKSSADVAVVSHEDISDLYQYGWPKNLLSYLRAGRPQVEVSRLPDWRCVATISPRTDLVRSASSTEVGIQRRSSTIITRRPKGVRHSRSFMEDANPTLKYLDVPLTHGPPSQPIIFEDLTIRRSPSPALLRPTSRMSCLSASTDIASSASTPSRSPSPAFPFTPQSTSVAEAGISSSPEKDWDTAMNDSSPQPTYAGYNSTYGYDVQIGPVPRRTSVAGQPYLYPRYPPSLGRVSGSTSSLRGPRPRPLSTRPSVSNLLGLANIKVI